MLLLFESEENQWLKEASVQEVSEVLHLLFQEVSELLHLLLQMFQDVKEVLPLLLQMLQEIREVLPLLFLEASQGQRHGDALALHGPKLPYATTDRWHACCGRSIVHISVCVRYAIEHDADGTARRVTVHNDASLSATAIEYDE